MNKLLCFADAYKQSHHKFYPPNTEYIYSYLEARGGKDNEYKDVVFFGLEYLLRKYFTGQFVTIEDVIEAKEYFRKFFDRDDVFNYDGWMYIAEHHNGRLPIIIKAPKEGSVIPIRNILMSVENTDPKCAWLTNWVETELLHLWYSCTVATISRECKKTILQWLIHNGTPESINYKLVDFGQRGVSSLESAGIGGAAHLVNFNTTDTLAGVDMIRHYYDSESIIGCSIPATEHSTIISWGTDKERAAYENVLDKYPNGLVACVSDSYDILNACENIWGDELKNKILIEL